MEKISLLRAERGGNHAAVSSADIQAAPPDKFPDDGVLRDEFGADRKHIVQKLQEALCLLPGGRALLDLKEDRLRKDL